MDFKSLSQHRWRRRWKSCLIGPRLPGAGRRGLSDSRAKSLMIVRWPGWSSDTAEESQGWACRRRSKSAPHGSFAEIGKMISRSAFNQLRHSTLLLLIAFAGMALTYILPPLLAVFSHQLLPSFMGAAAWLLMGVSFLPVLRFYRLVRLVSAASGDRVVLHGCNIPFGIQVWTGLGGEWKGRVQDPGRQTVACKFRLSDSARSPGPLRLVVIMLGFCKLLRGAMNAQIARCDGNNSRRRGTIPGSAEN